MSRNARVSLGFHTLFVAFSMAPIIAVSLAAFTPDDYLSVPHGTFSLRWFHTLLARPDFLSAGWLSLKLAAAAATLATIISAPAAFTLARVRFAEREALNALFMSPLTIPHVVLGIALLRYFVQLGVGTGFAGLLAGHVLLVVPFTLRTVIASAAGLDTRIQQAAISLGAGPFVTFCRITLPLIGPGIAAGWLLAFIVSFDDVAMTVFLVSPATETLPLRLLNHIQETTDPLVAAASSILIGGTALLALLIDRLYGLDRLLSGRDGPR